MSTLVTFKRHVRAIPAYSVIRRNMIEVDAAFTAERRSLLWGKRVGSFTFALAPCVSSDVRDLPKVYIIVHLVYTNYRDGDHFLYHFCLVTTVHDNLERKTQPL